MLIRRQINRYSGNPLSSYGFKEGKIGTYSTAEITNNTVKAIVDENASVSHKSKVLLCAICKMENYYIREWVEHYKSLGFDNICLFDNNDVDGEHLEDVIGDYIDEGFVILKDARGFYRYQIESYNVCYNQYKNEYKWIAYFDIDEFLWIDKKYNNDVKKFLAEPCFNQYNCVRVCWENYDDNGIIKVENDNYSITRFTHPITGTHQSKAFVKTVFDNIENESPHIMSKKIVFRACNALGRRCRNGIDIGVGTTLERAKLKHYRLKTIDEYVRFKMIRMWPTNFCDGGKKALNVDYFFANGNKRTQEKLDYAYSIIEERKPIYINAWVDTDKEGNLKNRNWGDDINIYFLSEICNRDVKIYDKTNRKDTNYQVIGSIICNTLTNNRTVIWGSGIPDDRTNLTIKPKKVCAVRGPMTRKKLISKGISCPEVYGDPALLLPLYYKPQVEKKYKVGLIPHFSNINHDIIKEMSKKEGVKIINLSKYNKWTDIIDEILSCEIIVSESLHGLILAGAYELPNIWINIEDNPRKNKGYFKYHDFFLSLGKDRLAPLSLKLLKNVKDIEMIAKKYERVNNIDLNKLIEACPFELKLGNKKAEE